MPQPAHAQTALQDQINAVDHVQQQNNADQERQAIKAQAERAAIRQKREDEFHKDKQREQSYEDELRHVEVEAQKTQLSVMKAKANRANDYIDQELNKEKAKTDVIQSQADATRNVPQGSKEMMQGMGKGAAKEGWWASWFK